METRITVAGGGPGYLGSLYEWLRMEDDLRGSVRLARAPLDQEEMGAAHDAIVIAAGSGGALTVLASALPVWLRQRRGSQVEVEVTNATWGVHLVVRADRADDAERVLRQVLNSVPGAGDAR